MDNEPTSVDKDYVENFNKGYVLAKRLDLKRDSLRDSVDKLPKAIQHGMEAYRQEISLDKTRDETKKKVLGRLEERQGTNRDQPKERGRDMDR